MFKNNQENEQLSQIQKSLQVLHSKMNQHESMRIQHHHELLETIAELKNLTTPFTTTVSIDNAQKDQILSMFTH